jgi:small-conductance mechanosensitive channel
MISIFIDILTNIIIEVLEMKDNKIIIEPKPIDGRYLINALSKIVRDKMKENPEDGNIYCFINKKLTVIRLLQYTDKGPAILKKDFTESIDWVNEDIKEPIILCKPNEKKKFMEYIDCPEKLSNK